MTDPVPSKEKLPDWLRRWYALKGELRFREAADELERLQREITRITGEREPPHCSTCECGAPVHNEVAGCRCKGHPTNCYRHPHDCGCTAAEPPVTPPSAIPFAGVSKGVSYEALANATYPERMYGGDEPLPRYQCMVAGCPANHVSKWDVCPAHTSTVTLPGGGVTFEVPQEVWETFAPRDEQ